MPSRKNIRNKFSHLTNYSINKFNSKFQKNQRIGDRENYNEKGHKRSLKWFLKHVDSLGRDSGMLWNEIKSIALKTLCSIQPTLKHCYSSLKSNDFWSGCCFEILGFDIMVSDRLKPYILEVNSSPSLGTDSALDEEIKGGLIRDTLTLMDFSARRKRAIIREERERLSRRMFTGVREKVSASSRTAMKCKWIQQAEEAMVRQTGSLGGFEKIFGVDEYTDVVSRFEKSLTRSQSGPSELLSSKRTSLTVKRRKKTPVLKKSESQCEQRLVQTLLDEGNCLGVRNRHKIFEFIRYAELFEKKAHVSRSKRSRIESLVLQELDNPSLGEGAQLTSRTSQAPRAPAKPAPKKQKLSARKSPKLRKYKSCAVLGPKPQLRLNRENETFHKLFNFQFYDRKRFLQVANLCPMVRLLFDLLRFLVDFELRLDVSTRLRVLSDFRWKRICFCRLCSFLTKIEKNHQFVFVKLKHFLRFYGFPKAKPDSALRQSSTRPPPAFVSATCHVPPQTPSSCRWCSPGLIEARLGSWQFLKLGPVNLAIVISHLRCLIMYLFDQNVELHSQFECPKPLAFKTGQSTPTSPELLLPNCQRAPQPGPKEFFMGSTFHKMNVDLKLNNMRMQSQLTGQSSLSRPSQHNHSQDTLNDSQLGNVRTSYLLEKYEFSK